MIRVSSIFSNGLVVMVTFLLGSCSNERKPMEFGSLLWVDKCMSDSVVRRAVKECFDNTSMIVCQISWAPNDTTFLNNVDWYRNLANEGNKAFMLNLDWQNLNRTGSSGNWNFGKDSADLIFFNDVLQLVDTYKPNYLNLGVEINYYALTNPDGFKSFVGTFNKLKTTLKSKHKEMQIGVTFQLELLFGNHSGWRRTKCTEPLTCLQENLDFIGISTYPDVFKSNSELNISTDYLDSLDSLSPKPIGITETGISSRVFSNSVRIAYVRSILNKAREKEFDFFVWGSLIDCQPKGDWRSAIGLMDNYGNHKAEFEVWSSIGKHLLNKN